MAYMRGKNYVWSDGDNLHINDFVIAEKIMDEYVVMKFARMNKKQINEVEKRALKNHFGNFGCDELAKKHGKPTVIEQLKTGKNRKK